MYVENFEPPPLLAHLRSPVGKWCKTVENFVQNLCGKLQSLKTQAFLV